MTPEEWDEPSNFHCAAAAIAFLFVMVLICLLKDQLLFGWRIFW